MGQSASRPHRTAHMSPRHMDAHWRSSVQGAPTVAPPGPTAPNPSLVLELPPHPRTTDKPKNIALMHAPPFHRDAHGQDVSSTQMGLFMVPSAGQHDEPAPKMRSHAVQGQVLQPTAGS